MKPPMNGEQLRRNQKESHRRDAEPAEVPSLGAHASSVPGVSNTLHAGCVRSQESVPRVSAVRISFIGAVYADENSLRMFSGAPGAERRAAPPLPAAPSPQATILHRRAHSVPLQI